MDAFCEMGLSDTSVSALHKAEPRPYTGLLLEREANMENSQKSICLFLACLDFYRKFSQRM